MRCNLGDQARWLGARPSVKRSPLDTDCESFNQEFAALSPSNQIYKLVGPVLLKQDQVEAKANVDKRLEYIAGEM